MHHSHTRYYHGQQRSSVVLDGLCYSRKDQVETSVLFAAPAARSLIGLSPIKENYGRAPRRSRSAAQKEGDRG
jgi:hypothetical protein